MKHYAVAELDVTDPAWVPEYVEKVTKMVEARGGRYLARTTKIERIEGEREAPQVFLIIEWPSKEAAEAFYESDEYRPYRDSRQRGARNEFFLVAGEDVNGVARMEEAPTIPVFRGGTGPRPGIDLTSNRALFEALDDGVPPDKRR
jgi:uncharacterized protein (DUF1330 family)